MAGRGTTATIALVRAKITFTLHEYEHDPRSGSYGLEASDALGGGDLSHDGLLAADGGRECLEVKLTVHGNHAHGERAAVNRRDQRLEHPVGRHAERLAGLEAVGV